MATEHDIFKRSTLKMERNFHSGSLRSVHKATACTFCRLYICDLMCARVRTWYFVFNTTTGRLQFEQNVQCISFYSRHFDFSLSLSLFFLKASSSFVFCQFMCMHTSTHQCVSTTHCARYDTVISLCSFFLSLLVVSFIFAYAIVYMHV